MANFIKASYQYATALMRHDFRTNENYSNENIDKEKSCENITWKGGSQTYTDAINKLKEYLNTIPHAKRKDFKPCMSYCISCPTILNTKQEQLDFFNIAMKDMKERIGKEKIISANIHFDEKDTLPHLHVIFVPIVETKQNDFGYKICAKDFCTRTFLRNWHPTLNAKMKEHFGAYIEPELNKTAKYTDKELNRSK